jgi:hypothetical protein
VNGKRGVTGESNEIDIITLLISTITTKGIYVLTLIIDNKKYTPKNN